MGTVKDEIATILRERITDMVEGTVVGKTFRGRTRSGERYAVTVENVEFDIFSIELELEEEDL